MDRRKLRSWSFGEVLLLGTLIAGFLTLGGCGGGYDTPATGPVATKTDTALIDAPTLKGWMDKGLMNVTNGEKVVVLSVSDQTNYDANHIPGALIMDSNKELTKTRLEGVDYIGSMILDGTSLDTVIKRSGIDANTTVVFSVYKNGRWMNLTRDDFTFRYWGFPKERLKILNGGDDAWVDAGYALMTATPTVRPSNYSVRNNKSLNTGLYYSIGEMVNLVDQINLGSITTGTTGVTILDERGPIASLPTTYVANATVDDYNQYGNNPTNAATVKTVKINDLNTLTTRLTAKGVTQTKAMNYVYCASGMRASVAFFVLDGVMGWPATLYDGSWNQWSAYRTANLADVSGQPSPWRIDINTPSTTLPRTTGSALTGTMVMFGTPTTSLTDPAANQIKLDNLNYYNTGATSTNVSTAPGSSAPGGC